MRDFFFRYSVFVTEYHFDLIDYEIMIVDNRNFNFVVFLCRGVGAWTYSYGHISKLFVH